MQSVTSRCAEFGRYAGGRTAPAPGGSGEFIDVIHGPVSRGERAANAGHSISCHGKQSGLSFSAVRAIRHGLLTRDPAVFTTLPRRMSFVCFVDRTGFV